MFFRNINHNYPAIKYCNENEVYTEISWNSLAQKTNEFKEILIKNSIKVGDRVVGYCSNTPEVVAAFLATNSLGAIWSSCSPDFGYDSVFERFDQIKPDFLFFHADYQYGGKKYSLENKVKKLKKSIISIKAIFDLNTMSAFSKKSESTEIDSIPVSCTFEDISFPSRKICNDSLVPTAKSPYGNSYILVIEDIETSSSPITNLPSTCP